MPVVIQVPADLERVLAESRGVRVVFEFPKDVAERLRSQNNGTLPTFDTQLYVT